MEGNLSSFLLNNTKWNPSSFEVIMTTLCFALFVLVLVSLITSDSAAEAFRSMLQKIQRTVASAASQGTSRINVFPFVTTQNGGDGTSENNKTISSLQWWEDLAPPFGYRNSLREGEGDDKLFDDIADVEESLSEGGECPEDETVADVTHFVFLVHGHRGYSKDLSYLEHVMQRVARREKRKLNLLQKRQRQESEAAEEQQQQSDLSDQSAAASSTVGEAVATLSLSSSSSSLRGEEEKDSEDKTTLQRETAYPFATKADSQTAPNRRWIKQDLVVHATICNERKTEDGVAAGGERLVEEIKKTISQEMSRRRHRESNSNGDDLPVVTLSLLGNSLGGLYSRYAIAKLAQSCQKQQQEHGETSRGDLSSQTRRKDPIFSNDIVLDGKYRLYFNIFCTTATPHLGCSGHTFLPIPRTAEIGVAHAMGSTGKDLFRLNDLMKDMCTQPAYLKPLACFRKRIAYANAYGTDFPVPARTAAFLSDTSSYPHHFLEDCHDEDRLVVDDNGLVIATLHTPPAAKTHQHLGEEDDSDFFVAQNDEDELVHMSSSLDSLGWKKVFVDVRKEIPKIPLPPINIMRRNDNGTESSSGDEATAARTSMLDPLQSALTLDLSANTGNSQPASRSTTSSVLNDSDQQPTLQSISAVDAPGKQVFKTTASMATVTTGAAATTINNNNTTPIHLLKLHKGNKVSSKDVAAAVTAPLFEQSKFHWPVGHNMIVAFSRSRFSTYMNKAGRPVVDVIAKDLVQNIFTWHPQEQESPQEQQEEPLNAAVMTRLNEEEITPTQAQTQTILQAKELTQVTGEETAEAMLSPEATPETSTCNTPISQK